MKREMTVEDVMEIGAELRRQAIASATPEERLAGLAPEEMAALRSGSKRHSPNRQGNPSTGNGQASTRTDRRNTVQQIFAD